MLYHTVQDVEVPRLGFGTWQLRDEDATRATAEAIEAGYRHIDTAAIYKNEREVGKALAQSGLLREELFVTTKIWMDDIKEQNHVAALDKCLERLGLEQVDLVLLHWPINGMPVADQVAPLADLKRSDKTRLIGVSNYPSNLLLQAVSACEEPLACNQCEYHPLLDQDKVLKACRGFDMLFTSYSPIGQGAVLENPAITRLAEAHGKKPAQIVLRWHLQQANVAAIPRSSSADHIAENFDIFDFELSPTDMKTVYGLMMPDGRLIDPDWAPEWD